MTSSILGCGWLGFPLAEKLIASGFAVKGSTTSEAKLPTLAAAGIRPFLIDLSDSDRAGWSDFFAADVVIIAIPPKSHYAENIRRLMPYLNGRDVILISSTSVYGNVEGCVTEESPVLPDTASGKEMAAAEKILRGNNRATIVRFGGLIGRERHPVTYLSGRSGVADPDAPVNLIHLADAVDLILKIIERKAWGRVFNGVFPEHPSRRDFYTSAADRLGIARPHFQETGNAGKSVSSEKAVRELAFRFRHRP